MINPGPQPHLCKVSDGEGDNDGHDYDADDADDDVDKPRLRPLQSVGLCSLSSPTQEPVSPRDKSAGRKYGILCVHSFCRLEILERNLHQIKKIDNILET